jgi:dinuclear metal center YbgI/SA1388 family protein
MPSVGTIRDFLNRLAPQGLAADWDNVGLLLGDPGCEVQRLLTCLTLTPEVVAEAIEHGAQMIVAHHPILFRGAKRLTLDDAEGRRLWSLARAGISVYSPHTAFDNCAGGINDIVARRLGLIDVKPLRPGRTQSHKIVVFVPDKDLSNVSDAMFAAGAGVIGQYSQCSFRLAGTGTFFGSDAANPTVGQKGRREEVSEWRLEVVCPDTRVNDALAAMRKAHSYEEPAYDVYPLRPTSGVGHEGRYGQLAAAMSLDELARLAQRQLQANAVQVVGCGPQEIKSLAIACGAAGEFLDDALRARADAFLTGEMRFHDCLRAKEMGLALILPGHYATERPAVEELAALLLREWPGLTIWASRSECDPLWCPEKGS